MPKLRSLGGVMFVDHLPSYPVLALRGPLRSLRVTKNVVSKHYFRMLFLFDLLFDQDIFRIQESFPFHFIFTFLIFF